MSTLFVNPQTYLHDIAFQSMVQVVVGDSSPSALLETGSETCLISESVLKELQSRIDIELVDKKGVKKSDFLGNVSP